MLFQDHLDLRARREQRLAAVVGADGITRRYAEEDHHRPLVTIFGEVVVAIERSTAAAVPKRQVEALTQAAAVDFAAFFDQAARPVAQPGEVVVISVDGKGIVMRPEGLRAATAAKAATSEHKLAGGCRGARRPTANGWPRSEPSTPSPRCRAPARM